MFLTDQRAVGAAWRFGDDAGSWNPDPAKRKPYPGSQFPLEAYDNLVKQIVPRWTTTNDAIMAAYNQLVDKVCPCVLLVHSQSGTFGYKAALAHPDKVKALVIVEGHDPRQRREGGEAQERPDPGALRRQCRQERDVLRPARRTTSRWRRSPRRPAAAVEIVNLPDIGIKGNSHFMMMEKNNAEIAEVIQKWLVGKGLVE